MTKYEWDDAKAQSNLVKHGIDFADAVEALSDERAVTVADDHATEERYVTLGIDPRGRLIAVVYTWRGKSIRVISARKATRNEARLYAAGEP